MITINDAKAPGAIGFYQGTQLLGYLDATDVPWNWLTAIQQELLAFLNAVGAAPDETGANMAQVLAACEILFIKQNGGVSQDGIATDVISLGWDGTHVLVTVDGTNEGAIAFEAWVTAAIAIEAAAREAADTAEVTAREAEDVQLQTNITAEATARAAADTAEATAREAEDTQLQTNITAEGTARAAEDAQLQTNITAEGTARAAEDTALQAGINAEAVTRGGADTVLQANIAAEATARGDEDATLQGNINAEAATRGMEDAALQAEIDLRALMSAFDFGTTINNVLHISPKAAGAPQPIIQWGTGNTVTGEKDYQTFPTPFPNACLKVVICEGAVGGWLVGGVCEPVIYGVAPGDAAGFFVSAARITSSGSVFEGGDTFNFIAIGW